MMPLQGMIVHRYRYPGRCPGLLYVSPTGWKVLIPALHAKHVLKGGKRGVGRHTKTESALASAPRGGRSLQVRLRVPTSRALRQASLRSALPCRSNRL